MTLAKSFQNAKIIVKVAIHAESKESESREQKQNTWQIKYFDLVSA